MEKRISIREKAGPGRIPCIVEAVTEKDVVLQRTRFLVSPTMTLTAFIHSIKEADPCNKGKDKSRMETLFFFIGETLILGTDTMGTIWSKYKEEDDFLYIVYSRESAFG